MDYTSTYKQQEIQFQEHCFQIHQRVYGPHLYIVASFYDTPKEMNKAIEVLSDELKKILQGYAAQVVHERWFGATRALEEIIQNQLSKDEATHLHCMITPLDGEPCFNPDSIAGVQIEAILCSQEVTAPVPCYDEKQSCHGFTWQEGNARFTILQNLRTEVQDLATQSRPEQTTYALKKADTILRSIDSDYHFVTRTWIYLDDILAWYTPFNQARTAFYRSIGIMPDLEKSSTTPPSECYLPASTGIRGRNTSGAACTVDLIAVEIPKESKINIRRLTNKKQKDAFRYGAAFARASVLETPTYSEVQISGTAAIDETGASILPGDTEGQIRYTLDTIQTLIAEAGFELTDICSATAFLKYRKDLPLLLQILKEKGLEKLPVVFCHADICRDELLFEMDGIAAK